MWAWALQAAGEQEMDALDLKFLTHTHTHTHPLLYMHNRRCSCHHGTHQLSPLL